MRMMSDILQPSSWSAAGHIPGLDALHIGIVNNPTLSGQSEVESGFFKQPRITRPHERSKAAQALACLYWPLTDLDRQLDMSAHLLLL